MQLLSPLFVDALGFAVEIHAAQERKLSGAPYVSHPLRVCGTVLDHGGNETQAIAALLHDAAEDQGGLAMLRTIEERFGAEVSRLVDACSDTLERPKPPWRERKEAFIERMRDASADVTLVVASDKLDNSRCLVRDLRVHGGGIWRSFRGGRDGSLWYFRSLTEVLRRSAPGALAEELHRVVTEMEDLAMSMAIDG